MKILAIITDGFEELEAVGTIALLRRAKLDVTIASLYSTEATGRYMMSLKNLENLNNIDISTFDMLLLPGGPEYIIEEKDKHFLNIVKAFFSNNKYIAAICAAPTILGHLGLLKNKRYTCFTSMNEDFGGEYVDAYTCIDDKLITGRSCAASIDFALLIIRELLGEEKEEEIKKEIYYHDDRHI